MAKVNDELLKKTEEWMGLERATFKQREKAAEFYDKQLMRLITNSFIERNKAMVIEKVGYMIMSVGTSYEPLALSLSLYKPERVMFLYTEKSERFIEKIVKFCKLEATAYDKRLVDDVNPLPVYQEIKNAYLMWKKPDKIYIDFTGGTKAMAVAAAMAGAVVDIQLVYVGSEEYLVDFRKPKPGSERVLFVTNPYEVFGDLEIEKAVSFFWEHNYASAREKLQIVKEKVPDPSIRQQLNFMYYLSEVYEHWDALEFDKAYDEMCNLLTELKRDSRVHPDYIMMDFYGKLNSQKEILKPLAEISEVLNKKNNLDVLAKEKYIFPLMFTMCYLAQVREEQQKYDSSTLLLYRLLEMIEQRRLANYNISVSKVDYLAINYPVSKGYTTDNKTNMEILRKRVSTIKAELFKKGEFDYLPLQISLLEGFIFLSALDDRIMISKNEKPIDMLKRIRSMVYLRNNSIFAHGLAPVSYADFYRFKQFVIKQFMAFCKVEKLDYIKYMDDIKWLNPKLSKYYSQIGAS